MRETRTVPLLTLTSRMCTMRELRSSRVSSFLDQISPGRQPRRGAESARSQTLETSAGTERASELLERVVAPPPMTRVGVWPVHNPEPLTERLVRYGEGVRRRVGTIVGHGGLPRHRAHRKLWEWAVIVLGVEDAGLLGPQRRGLGFAVGQEPLPAYFGNLGVEVVATDMPVADDRSSWAETGQHAASLESLAWPHLSSSAWKASVSFRGVDMTRIPGDLDGFDFCWSSCAFEHLGDLATGLEFVERSLDCLRPGGWAFHTTEYNLSSNEDTIESGDSVIYRRRDIEALAARLHDAGHEVFATFVVGTEFEDRYVDPVPWIGSVHLRLDIGGYASTSYLLAIRKSTVRP